MSSENRPAAVDALAMSASEVRACFLASGEVAVLDLREEGVFGRDHMLFAVPAPLSTLELRIGDMAPRRDVPVILISAGLSDQHLAAAAARRLNALGYADVRYLEGGMAAWRTAGYEAFSGVNVPSKAFGEFIEHTCGTPRIDAPELNAMKTAGENMVILDSRPMAEYQVMNIPGGIDVPGAELVHRVFDMAPDPETTVVVNCAGRTRSIIGAQSLINAGVPNKVVALKDGTMGWHLAGFRLEHGQTRRPRALTARGRRRAKEAAERVRRRFGVRMTTWEEVSDWRADVSRTTYLLDVRSPEEFQESRAEGSRNAPGGQLVQAWDHYVAVQNARLVLLDDDGVRATMTASWMIQMGWDGVYVLADLEGAPRRLSGPYKPGVLGLSGAPVDGITAPALKEALDDGTVTLIDLADSLTHRAGHIPGARFAIRANLSGNLKELDPAKPIVLTSPDGVLARLSAADLAGAGRLVRLLNGGTAAWESAGFAMTAGFEDALDEPIDKWRRPYDLDDNREGAMKQYLSWEVDLVHQIKRDGTTRFRTFPPG